MTTGKYVVMTSVGIIGARDTYDEAKALYDDTSTRWPTRWKWIVQVVDEKQSDDPQWLSNAGKGAS